MADAIRFGYAVALMRDGIGFLGDPEPVLDQMRRAGARIDALGAFLLDTVMPGAR